MSALRIFLSHSHQDNDWCSAFADELKHYGADVWYDKQGLYVGAKWRQTIETELEARDIFLLVLTPASWASDWVQDELTLAMDHKKRIVSILHQPTEIKGFITTRQMLAVIGLSGVDAAKSVSAALDIVRSERPATSEGKQAAEQEYEYFESTQIQTINGCGFALIRRVGNKYSEYQYTTKQVHYSYFESIANGPNRVTLEVMTELSEYAKANGFEELPEKGWAWYNRHYRRKKQ